MPAEPPSRQNGASHDPLETVKAAIAETPDPENREATLREVRGSRRALARV